MTINTQSYGNSQAHSEMDQRDNGSVTHSQDARIHAADIERYVKGVKFPANKQDLAEQAVESNAPNHIVNLLQQLPTSEFGSSNDSKMTLYNNMDELLREIGKIE
jgi:hypothetical protein